MKGVGAGFKVMEVLEYVLGIQGVGGLGVLRDKGWWG